MTSICTFSVKSIWIILPYLLYYYLQDQAIKNVYIDWLIYWCLNNISAISWREECLQGDEILCQVYKD